MKHVILVKYNEEVSKAQKAELIPEITVLFERTTEIPGITGVQLFPNVVDRENRYDLMIQIEMEREALDAYDHSEPHRQWKEQYGHLLAKKAIFDYD